MGETGVDGSTSQGTESENSHLGTVDNLDITISDEDAARLAAQEAELRAEALRMETADAETRDQITRELQERIKADDERTRAGLAGLPPRDPEEDRLRALLKQDPHSREAREGLKAYAPPPTESAREDAAATSRRGAHAPGSRMQGPTRTTNSNPAASPA